MSSLLGYQINPQEQIAKAKARRVWALGRKRAMERGRISVREGTWCKDAKCDEEGQQERRYRGRKIEGRPTGYLGEVCLLSKGN